MYSIYTRRGKGRIKLKPYDLQPALHAQTEGGDDPSCWVAEPTDVASLPRRIENWSLTSLQQRLVKTGGRLVQYARYYWLLLAESHLNRRRFGAMLGRIALLPVSTG